MLSNFVHKSSYDQEDHSEGNSHDNASLSNNIGRSTFFVKRESKLLRETKILRAASLIEDANIDEVKLRFREHPDYKSVKFVIFPDDTFKLFWDILIVWY